VKVPTFVSGRPCAGRRRIRAPAGQKIHDDAVPWTFPIVELSLAPPGDRVGVRATQTGGVGSAPHPVLRATFYPRRGETAA
jgi:hypothetical protein